MENKSALNKWTNPPQESDREKFLLFSPYLNSENSDGCCVICGRYALNINEMTHAKSCRAELRESEAPHQPHEHSWFECDAWGTKKCRVCGLFDTQLEAPRQSPDPVKVAESWLQTNERTGQWIRSCSVQYLAAKIAELLKGGQPEPAKEGK